MLMTSDCLLSLEKTPLQFCIQGECYLSSRWLPHIESIWAEYFELLFTVDSSSKQLQSAGFQTLDGDPPIDETAHSFDDVKEAVAILRGGKAAGTCNISTDLV